MSNVNIPVLPEWTRWSWVNQTARSWWGPQFLDATRAFQELEVLSVVEGLRPAAWQFVTPDKLIEKVTWAHNRGLEFLPLEQSHRRLSSYSSLPGPDDGPLSYRGLLIRPEHRDKVYPFTGSTEQLGTLLGYPACCRQAFTDTWEKGQVDSTWEQFTNMSLAGRPNLAHTLWRWKGLRLVAHMPCSYACIASQQIAEDFYQLGYRNGLREEVAFMQEVLAWPVKWSRIFGIAELVSPAIKISTRSDWTPTKQGFNVEGVYHTPHETLWTDNGFNSAEGMRNAHTPLLMALSQQVPEKGRIMDLGCGNGLLLRRLKVIRPDVVIGGVDHNADAIARIPMLTGKWYTGSIQTAEWRDWNPDVVLISAPRFTEMTVEDRDTLLAGLSHVSRVIIYTYSDSFREGTLTEYCQSFGVTLTQELITTTTVHVGIVLRN